MAARSSPIRRAMTWPLFSLKRAAFRPIHSIPARCRMGNRLPPSAIPAPWTGRRVRSEEHTSELQSLMRISYAVFCLKKKTKIKKSKKTLTTTKQHNVHTQPHKQHTDALHHTTHSKHYTRC